MMALLRLCKPDICCAVRNYSMQRYQQTHYETLNISSNASQKEIRRAFLKLSKQLHPDTSGKHSHTDFVKLNEAYSILGKESSRRQYDLDLKCRSDSYYTHGCTPNMQYGSQWEYEVRTAGGPWPPPKQKPSTPFGLIVALLIFGMGLFQLIFLLHSMRVRKLTFLRSAHLQRRYQLQYQQNIKPDNISQRPAVTDFSRVPD